MDGSLTEKIKKRYKTEIGIDPVFPEKMKIEISNVCNHHCIFCGRSKMSKPMGFINEDFYNRIMREAFDAGIREAGLFINGEPFTNKSLAHYIAWAKKIGFSYIYLTTNGALASPQRIQETVNAGLDSIKFSINAGTRETYKTIHGSDDFDTVIKNIIFCNEYRKKSGKKFNIFASCVMSRDVETEKNILNSIVKKYVDELVFYKMRGQGGLMNENSKLTYSDFTKVSACSIPFNTVNIDFDGKLLMCCEDINQSVDIADLNKTSLKEAWYNEKMTLIRKRHIEHRLTGTICESCLASGGAVVEVLARESICGKT
jgi:radical SAM protein with 4Fe4S-binding SPASM domain